MKLNIAHSLNQAMVALKEGKLEDAKRLYQTVLKIQPMHPDANHNLGILMVLNNKTDEALPLFKKALEVSSNEEQFWVSYIGALLKERNLDVASLIIAQAKEKRIALEKISIFEKTNNLLKLYQNKQYNEAESLVQSLIEISPKSPFAWNILGAILMKKGRFSEALSANQTLVELSPKDAESHYNLAINYEELGRLDEAEESYRQAIAFSHDYASAYNNLGVILQHLGRLDEAEESYRQAILFKSDHGNAHRLLSKIKKFESKDERYLKMQELYLDKITADETLCHINFGLAKACEDLGDFKQAFKHLNEGNTLRKRLINYDISQDEMGFEQIKTNYQLISQCALDEDKIEKKLIPIFIVGMPRSGTTLVEQIISSHSEVTGAGELSFISKFGHSTATGSSQASKEALLKFRQEYLSELQNVSKGNSIIIDKMPQNFLYLGLIAAAFPEAKIVNVKRDPAAVCWANYKQYFSDKGLGYCYALDDVISYHALYGNLMQFWESSLSKRIYNLDYELLTVDQENVTHSLIDYLGLDWDEKFLSPQNNKRSIKTASDVQIRKKVYQGSSKQWKKYEPFLNGAFDVFK